MWLLHFIPDSYLEYAIFAVMAIGSLSILAGFLLKYFPGLKIYSLPVTVLGVFTTCVSMYLIGGYGVELEWRQKAQQLEVKVKEAEAKSAQVNTQIVEKLVTQKVFIKQKGEEVIKYVDREIVKYDSKYEKGGICEFPQEFIQAHNAAAKGTGINTPVTNSTEIPTEDINKAAKNEK
jgi:hypothetical protein